MRLPARHAAVVVSACAMLAACGGAGTTAPSATIPPPSPTPAPRARYLVVFVGVSALSLLENGDWVGEKEVALVPWDAGTDSGVTFLSADRPSRPRQPIARITTPPLAASGVAAPMGRFTFRRIP